MDGIVLQQPHNNLNGSESNRSKVRHSLPLEQTLSDEKLQFPFFSFVPTGRQTFFL